VFGRLESETPQQEVMAASQKRLQEKDAELEDIQEQGSGLPLST